MKIKRFYDNYRKKEIKPKNITSMACSNRDGVIDLVFYTDKHIKYPKPIYGYEKNSTNDFILEVEDELNTDLEGFELIETSDD